MHRIFIDNDLECGSRKREYVILQAPFDGGRRFLDTWSARRDDPNHCERLHFVGLCERDLPVQADDSALGQQLRDRWPLQVDGLHRLEFEDGKVVLTLAFGDITRLIQRIWLRADRFYIEFDRFDAERVFLAKALARVAGDQARIVASGADPEATKNALKQAGFLVNDGEFGVIQARFSPQWKVRRHEPPLPLSINEKHAIVVGAGLAGCALAERLASRGWRVSLIDRHAAPARDASGNPAGVFHPIVWRDDSIASRLTRAGFLYALHRWSTLERAGHDLKRSRDGLLQLADSAEDANAIADAIRSFGLPDTYVQPADLDQAARIAGVDVSRAGWFFPRGGSISPVAVCHAQLAVAGALLTSTFDADIARIELHDGVWHTFDKHGRDIASAPVLILANAGDAQRLATLHAQPTRGVRGQLSVLGDNPLNALRVPVVGDGYAVPLDRHRTLIGATYDLDSTDAHIRPPGHAENIDRVSRMMPSLSAFAPNLATMEGRVAFRSVTSDRLPMIGAIADEPRARANAAALSGAWPLDLPRAEGLYGAFAFGSRGLIWATLAAELIACQLEGEPWPIERDLAEAIDPGRFLLRALRHREFDPSCG